MTATALRAARLLLLVRIRTPALAPVPARLRNILKSLITKDGEGLTFGRPSNELDDGEATDMSRVFEDLRRDEAEFAIIKSERARSLSLPPGAGGHLSLCGGARCR